MKSILLLTVAFFFSSVLYSQSTGDSADIVKLLENDYKALGKSDIESRLRNCTADYLLIENGEIWTLQKEIEYMRSKQGIKTTRTDQFDFTTVKIIGQTAYAVYELRSQITRNNETKNYQWTESVIFVKPAGEWKIKLIHSTKVREF